MEEDYSYGPCGESQGVVVGLLVARLLFLSDSGAAVITDVVAELLGPVGLLLLPVSLVLLTRVLSSERRPATVFADVFASRRGSPVDAAVGLPVGVAAALLLILLMLHYRSSLFGSDE